MRKFGIIVFAVTFCFTAVVGIPKMQEVHHLKTECINLQQSNSQNQSELDNIQKQVAEEKSKLEDARKASNNPYDTKAVTDSIKKLEGVQIKSVDVYNSSEDAGNVLIKTIKGSKGLAKLDPEANLLDYKLTTKNVDKTVKGIAALKLNVTSMNVNKEKGSIDLSVKFVGGEE